MVDLVTWLLGFMSGIAFAFVVFITYEVTKED